MSRNVKVSSRVKKILAAVENTKYKSRTVNGISRETGIPLNIVQAALNGDEFLKSKVMIVPGVKKENKPLYVTVDRYKKRTPLTVRIMNFMRKKEYTNE
ncbi:hypothetical protein [Chromobacterium sphagni]|uniref:hypothetical protein n=1 Tax=Chromobacterium sphagni TaxID=1903179 RepID=UPI0011138F9B|nr:hypothetical protein [Chromobacterium sphagni]